MSGLTLVLLLPFLGTAAGAAGVFFPGLGQKEIVSRFLTGFAAGVMVAASIWSLILPAIEQSLGSFVPAFAGTWAGVLFLLGLDHLVPHLHSGSSRMEGTPAKLSKTVMLTLAVTLHNLPEGMAVGVAAAAFLAAKGGIAYPSVLILSYGIALQNIPEGAIISMNLAAEGNGKGKSFAVGVLSGIVEPIAGFLTMLLAGIVTPVLPCCLCFAAGAMLYVVVENLIPEMSVGKHSDVGVIAFCTGFTVMMALDVALG